MVQEPYESARTREKRIENDVLRKESYEVNLGWRRTLEGRGSPNLNRP